MKNKLLVFDLDGTLVFSGGAGVKAIDKYFIKYYGLKNAFKNIDGRGKTDPNIIREMFVKKLGREATSLELKHFIKVYPRFLKPEVKVSRKYKMLKAVDKFLARISRLPGVFLALGTGNLEKTGRIKLSRANLNRFFPIGGFATDSIIREKLLKFAVKKANKHYKKKFKKKEIYIVGDTPLDVKAGKACGFKTVAIGIGAVSRKKVIASKPDFFFEDYSKPDLWIKKLGLK
ncbi:HAD family hydrolase [Elusimicrobiota bacterium]